MFGTFFSLCGDWGLSLFLSLSLVFLWVGWVFSAESEGKDRGRVFSHFILTRVSIHTIFFFGVCFLLPFACISNLEFVYFYPGNVFFSS